MLCSIDYLSLIFLLACSSACQALYLEPTVFVCWGTKLTTTIPTITTSTPAITVGLTNKTDWAKTKQTEKLFSPHSFLSCRF